MNYILFVHKAKSSQDCRMGVKEVKWKCWDLASVTCLLSVPLKTSRHKDRLFLTKHWVGVVYSHICC
jgi:hypothetical protein